MDPEEMSGGSNMEGNSIWNHVSQSELQGCACAVLSAEGHWKTNQTFIFGQQHGHSGIHLADGKGDEHFA